MNGHVLPPTPDLQNVPHKKFKYKSYLNKKDGESVEILGMAMGHRPKPIPLPPKFEDHPVVKEEPTDTPSDTEEIRRGTNNIDILSETDEKPPPPKFSLPETRRIEHPSIMVSHRPWEGELSKQISNSSPTAFDRVIPKGGSHNNPRHNPILDTSRFPLPRDLELARVTEQPTPTTHPASPLLIPNIHTMRPAFPPYALVHPHHIPPPQPFAAPVHPAATNPLWPHSQELAVARHMMMARELHAHAQHPRTTSLLPGGARLESIAERGGSPNEPSQPSHSPSLSSPASTDDGSLNGAGNKRKRKSEDVPWWVKVSLEKVISKGAVDDCDAVKIG